MKRKVFYSCLFAFTILNFFAQNETDSASINDEVPAGMSVELFRTKTSVKNKLVLVSFKADWCVVCKKQKPIIDQLKVEKQDILNLLVVDMEKNPLIAEYFEVDSLPVTMLFKDGVIIWDRLGLVSKNEIMEVVKAIELK